MQELPLTVELFAAVVVAALVLEVAVHLGVEQPLSVHLQDKKNNAVQTIYHNKLTYH